MKINKLLSLLIIGLILTMGLLYRSYEKNPKKIVAQACYEIDDKLITYVDNFCPNIGLKTMINKISDTGDFTFSLLAKADESSADKLNIIYLSDASNKKKSLYYKKSINKSTNEYREKIINNDIFISYPQVFNKSFYIDKNTAKSLSKESSVCTDMKWDFKDASTFETPKSFKDTSLDMKKYLQEEWVRFIKSARVKKKDRNIYQIILNSKDTQNLIEKIIKYFKDRNVYLFEKYPNITNKVYKFLNNIDNDSTLVFYMQIEDGNIKKIFSYNKEFLLEFGDLFTFKLPGINCRIKREFHKDRNTIDGFLNDSHFRLSYYFNGPKIIAWNKNNIVNLRFNSLEKNYYFNSFTSIEGAFNYKKIYANFYTFSKDISPDEDYIEILKIKQKDWDIIKKNFPKNFFN